MVAGWAEAWFNRQGRCTIAQCRQSNAHHFRGGCAHTPVQQAARRADGQAGGQAVGQAGSRVGSRKRERAPSLQLSPTAMARRITGSIRYE